MYASTATIIQTSTGPIRLWCLLLEGGRGPVSFAACHVVFTQKFPADSKATRGFKCPALLTDVLHFPARVGLIISCRPTSSAHFRARATPKR
jgi:hypothetical protein